MLSLVLGIFSAAVLTAAVSVYVFHDVDRDQMGHWNEAFAGLCVEFVLFTVLVGGGAAILTWAGRRIFNLAGYSPRSKSAFFVGAGVAVFQYPWEFLGRWVFPKFADDFLSAYLIMAIVACAVFIVRDNAKQKRLVEIAALNLIVEN